MDISWNTEDPDFTLCFQETALTYTPCALFWFLSTIEVYVSLKSKKPALPWTCLNLTKLVINLSTIRIWSKTNRLFIDIIGSVGYSQCYRTDKWVAKPVPSVSRLVLHAFHQINHFCKIQIQSNCQVNSLATLNSFRFCPLL